METYTWHPADKVEEFSPDRFDFIWNGDFTLFCAVPLRWWDDASYVAFQATDDGEE